MGQNLETKSKKKWVLPLVIVLVVLLVVGGVIAALRLGVLGGAGDDMYDMGDDMYSMGYDDASFYEFGAVNYYSGVVEAQETQEVQKDSSKEIAEVYVEVGDEVAKGDPLFAYKTDELKLDIEKAKLSLENTATNITEYNNQIDSYTAKMNEATDNAIKQDYQLKITDIQNQIRQAQLEQRTTQAEITAKQKSIENAVVKSTVDGVIKTISTSSTDNGPYMTILGTGSYRVKGSVDEMNVGMLSEGMAVTVHSRVDQSKTWSGTITKIDTEDVNKQNNSGGDYYYGGGGGGGESSTKYSFYVDLNGTDGLLLGQHVYIEPSMDFDTMSEDVEIDGVDDAVVEEGEETTEETEEE